jgi:tetratricopeptide (TPR) repeat protein
VPDIEAEFAAEAALRRRRLLRNLLIGGVIACVLMAAAFFGLRHWRAQQLSSEAVALIQSGNSEVLLHNAWMQALAAHGLTPRNIKVVRAVAQVADRVNPPEAVRFWRDAVRLSGGQVDDQLALVYALFRVGTTDEAELLLLELEQTHAEHEPVRIARIDYLLARDRAAEALERARQLAATPQASLRAHQLYVQITQVTGVPEHQTEGIDHLLALSGGEPEMARFALRNLTRFDGLTVEQRLIVADALERVAEGRGDRLAAIQQRLQVPDMDRQQIIDSAYQLFELTDDTQAAEFARWLNNQRLYNETLIVLPETRAVTRQDLLLLRADAMALLDQWLALQRLLQRTNLPLDSYQVRLFRMRTFLETGDERRAKFEWDRALLDAGRRPEALWFLERYAARLQATAYREEALIALMRLPGEARRAGIILLKLLEDQGRTVAIREQLEAMAALFPVDVAVRNDLIYFQLLIGEQLAGNLELARRLVADNPTFLGPRMTEVLGLLQLARYGEALERVRALDVDWNTVSDRYKMLLVCVLASNGHRDHAMRYMDALDRTRLLVEESRLLQICFGLDEPPRG